MTKYTEQEVRDWAKKYAVPGIPKTAEMLTAYADLLAAQPVAVPVGLRQEAEECHFLLAYLGAFTPDYIEGDTVEISGEDAQGHDAVAEVSITDLANRAAKLLEQLLAAPSPAAELKRKSFAQAGRFCMSEGDCIAAGINFAAYERGVADAIRACEQEDAK